MHFEVFSFGLHAPLEKCPFQMRKGIITDLCFAMCLVLWWGSSYTGLPVQSEVPNEGYYRNSFISGLDDKWAFAKAFSVNF